MLLRQEVPIHPLRDTCQVDADQVEEWGLEKVNQLQANIQREHRLFDVAAHQLSKPIFEWIQLNL